MQQATQSVVKTNVMTCRQRFLGMMEYQPVDQHLNWELGAWPQTLARWQEEGMRPGDISSCDWFSQQDILGLDVREHIPLNLHMIPLFEEKVIEEDEEHEIIQDTIGRIRKALKAGALNGTRTSMDQYLRHPVETIEDFRQLKKRYDPSAAGRYPERWREEGLPHWLEPKRPNVLVPGYNMTTLGFYWRSREWMGTENLSLAFCLQPNLMHEMMEFIADFTIEALRPLLSEGIDFDYVLINEDMAMKTGPLLGPNLYKEFIFPHMRRLVEFLKGHGVRYIVVDSDGNPDPLLPLLLDAGVDAILPLEQASEGTNPHYLRKKYGRALRLWGAVDKRELMKNKAAIDAHLRSMRPLIEEGGFSPTVDHAVSPDVSFENFLYYMDRKKELLAGRL